MGQKLRYSKGELLKETQKMNQEKNVKNMELGFVEYHQNISFPNRDEQFQDFLEQFIFDGDDDVRGVAFLSNLFQHRKME